MLIDLLVRAKALGHHTVLAALIDTQQTGNIALHKRHGFDQAAHLKEVGFKFGRWLDVVYLQKDADLDPLRLLSRSWTTAYAAGTFPLFGRNNAR